MSGWRIAAALVRWSRSQGSGDFRFPPEVIAQAVRWNRCVDTEETLPTCRWRSPSSARSDYLGQLRCGPGHSGVCHRIRIRGRQRLQPVATSARRVTASVDLVREETRWRHEISVYQGRARSTIR